MKKYNLLIPMVGKGQRFRDEGFTTPKQLIEVGHKQIIDWSLSCINTDECNFFRAAGTDIGACCAPGNDADGVAIDCAALANDGNCDEVCNTGACNNDGGDCE